MSAIVFAKSIGERPDILFTVSNDNINEIEKIWREICLKNGLVLIINPVFEYNSINSLGGLNAENIELLQKEWLGRKNVYLNNAFLELRKNGGNQIENPVCKAGSSVVVISPENKLILPCYHLGIQEFPIEGRLAELYDKAEIRQLRALEGRLPACQSCAINCYMQPSFAVELNKYWLLALPSTLKYNLMKGTWRKLFSRR
jgi:MoaA/NifB/PqqE/SkfB family radical SAM enzyme